MSELDRENSSLIYVVESTLNLCCNSISLRPDSEYEYTWPISRLKVNYQKMSKPALFINF